MMGTRAGFTRVPLAPPSANATISKPAAVKRAAGTPTAAHVGCSEYAMTVAARVYFSGFYRLIYFFTVVSSLVCVVWVRESRSLRVVDAAADGGQLLTSKSVCVSDGSQPVANVSGGCCIMRLVTRQSSD